MKGRDYYLKGQGVKRPVDPNVLAGKVLDAVAANKAMVIEPAQSRIVWRLNRFAPGFLARQSAKFVAKQRGDV